MTNILTRDARAGALARRDRPVRPGLVLAVVLIGQFMAVLDASIVNVAAPSIHASLRASGAGLQLVVAGYTITYAVLLVTGARLGDILGHRRVFLAGAGPVHARLARLRAGRHGPPADRPALRSGGRRRADDPAGAQPDPAHPRGPGPGPRDEQVLRGAGRRRGGGPGRRRPADQRQPVRLGLAAGLPGQRAHRRAAAGGRRPGAAARQGRARPDPRPARPGPAHPGRARVRPSARARPARTLAGLGLGPDGRERAPGRRLRRRRAAGGRRPAGRR